LPFEVPNAEGDLSERVRLRSVEIADDGDLRIQAPKDFLRGAAMSHPWTSDRSRAPRDWRLPGGDLIQLPAISTDNEKDSTGAARI